MTGCGCLLLVAILGALLYVVVAGSTDAGEPIEQALGILAAALLIPALARVMRASVA